MLISATFFHTSGSEPEPICVWILTILRFLSCAICFICGMYSCQTPKLDAGPPTFVRFVPPEPNPGFMRTPTSAPGLIFPNSSSCRREHALYFMPAFISSARLSGSCCDESDMWSAGIPASIARSTSYALEASICSPSELKSLSIARFEAAFIANLTVNPKALGNPSAFLACATRDASS